MSQGEKATTEESPRPGHTRTILASQGGHGMALCSRQATNLVLFRPKAPEAMHISAQHQTVNPKP